MSARYRIILFFATTFWLFPCELFSQIPNAGFENWAGGDPVGWGTTNDPLDNFFNVIRTNVAHEGTSAIQGNAVLLEDVVVPPIIQSGPDGQGFAHTQRSANFTGYYEFFPQGGDRFGINVALFNGGINGTLVALAAAALTPSVSTYTQFDVPFVYYSADPPDLCVIQILIIGPTPGNTWHDGSYFILDDISLSGTVDVDERTGQLPAVTRLLQNYPNPFNPSTTIRYELSAASVVTLKVYDVLGREVALLVSEKKEPGPHATTWDARNHPSGIYYCRLTAGEFSETMKLVLTK